MRLWVDAVLANFRRMDKVVMHCVAIPCVVLIFVRAQNFVQAQSTFSQDVINATTAEKMSALDQRLQHLEKSADAQFIALLGVFTALLVNVFQQKNRRGQR